MQDNIWFSVQLHLFYVQLVPNKFDAISFRLSNQTMRLDGHLDEVVTVS